MWNYADALRQIGGDDSAVPQDLQHRHFLPLFRAVTLKTRSLTTSATADDVRLPVLFELERRRQNSAIDASTVTFAQNDGKKVIHQNRVDAGVIGSFTCRRTGVIPSV